MFPFPLQPSQVGFSFFGGSDIDVENFQVDSKKPKAFVVIKFIDKYKEIYEEVIKTVCTELNMKVIKADEIFGPGQIISDITNSIAESTVVVADITSLEPNIFYEVGYAHALNKPTVLIAEKGTERPFDVESFRILYSTKILLPASQNFTKI